MSRYLTRMFHIARLLQTILQNRGEIVFQSELERYARLVTKDCTESSEEANERLVELLTSLLFTIVQNDRTRVMKHVVSYIEQVRENPDCEFKISLLIQTVEEAASLGVAGGTSLASNVIRHLKKASMADLNQMTAQTLAEEFHYSNSYFPKKFQEEQGYTVHEAIIYEKINRAFTMLSDENQDLSVKEVSRILGFSDRRYFSRLFHERLGMKPSDVKKLRSPRGASGGHF